MSPINFYFYNLTKTNPNIDWVSSEDARNFFYFLKASHRFLQVFLIGEGKGVWALLLLYATVYAPCVCPLCILLCAAVCVYTLNLMYLQALWSFDIDFTTISLIFWDHAKVITSFQIHWSKNIPLLLSTPLFDIGYDWYYHDRTIKLSRIWFIFKF